MYTLFFRYSILRSSLIVYYQFLYQLVFFDHHRPPTNSALPNDYNAFYPKGKKKQALLLGKDEHAEYHNGHIQQHVSFDLNFLSWKTRTLIFDNTPLPQVLKQLGKHFYKEFHIMDTKLDTLALTGTFKNQKIDDVLQEISRVLDIAFEETDGRIQVRAFDVQTNEE